MRILLAALLTSVVLAFSSISVNAAVVYNHPQEYEDVPTLLDIFTRRQKYWPDGTKIIVFIKPINSIEHKFFVMEWLGITLTKYKALLDAATYSGAASYVSEVNTDEEMLAAIATTPNSIGYLDNKVLVRGERGIKIISH